MRQLKIAKQVTNRETLSLDKYLHEIGKDELVIAAKELDVKMGRIIKQPIKNLVDYHIQYIFPKVS